MAVYEYKCKKCNHIFEENYDLGQAPKDTKCPTCKTKCGRVFSPPMIQFVGFSGFYVNDKKASRGKG